MSIHCNSLIATKCHWLYTSLSIIFYSK